MEFGVPVKPAEKINFVPEKNNQPSPSLILSLKLSASKYTNLLSKVLRNIANRLTDKSSKIDSLDH